MGGVNSIRCLKCNDLITKNNHSTQSCRIHECIFDRDDVKVCGDCQSDTTVLSCNCYHRTFRIKKKKNYKFKNFGSMSL